MQTTTEFAVPTGRSTDDGPAGPRLEPTPVDAQPGTTTTDDRTATFDGRGSSTFLADGHDEHTVKNSSGSRR